MTTPRVIRIDCCLSCPLRFRKVDDGKNKIDVCMHELTQDWPIPDFDEIPDWCELEPDTEETGP